MTFDPKLVITAALFPVIFFTGFWLRKQGWSYPTVLLTLHKLAALAAGVVIIMLIRPAWAQLITAWQGLFAVALTGVLWLLSGGTGGWLSATDKAPRLARITHTVTPVLTLLASVALAYWVLIG